MFKLFRTRKSRTPAPAVMPGCRHFTAEAFEELTPTNEAAPTAGIEQLGETRARQVLRTGQADSSS